MRVVGRRPSDALRRAGRRRRVAARGPSLVGEVPMRMSGTRYSVTCRGRRLIHRGFDSASYDERRTSNCLHSYEIAGNNYCALNAHFRRRDSSRVNLFSCTLTRNSSVLTAFRRHYEFVTILRLVSMRRWRRVHNTEFTTVNQVFHQNKQLRQFPSR